MINSDIERIFRFWFGDLNDWGMPSEEKNSLWFRYHEETDRQIEAEFGELVQSALRGQLEEWSLSPEGVVAQVILLDQFTRNIYRGSAAAFSGDNSALKLSDSLVAAGEDKALAPIYRVFLYIPYEHAEDIARQIQGVSMFEQLIIDTPEVIGESIQSFKQYAEAHRDVIEHFGRFPHRNKILGRISTDAELEHLKTQGGF